MKENATEDVCAAGYRHFRAGARTLDAVNERLSYYGYLRNSAPIGEHTLKHYAELEAYGEPTYLPINRWTYVVRPTRERK